MLKLLRWLVLIVFVINTPLYLLALSLTLTALNPTTYHRLIDELNIADRTRPALAHLALTKILPLTKDDTPSRALPELTDSEWATIAAELIPPDWATMQAHRLVDGLFAWFDTTAPLPSVQLDLNLPLDRLPASALLPFLRDAPTCGETESTTGLGVYATCLPPGANVQSLAAQTATRIPNVVPRLMGIESLLGLGLADPSMVSWLDMVRFTVRWSRVAIQTWRYFTLTWLCLYGLLAFVTWRDVFTQLVLPVGLTGIFSVLLAAGVSTQSTGLAYLLWPTLNSLGREMIATVLQIAGVQLLGGGFSLILLAAILWGVNRLTQKKTAAPAKPMRVRRQFL